MEKHHTSQKNYLVPLVIVGIMFFVIGFGVGISGFLTPALKSAFNLTTSQSYLVTAAIFSAFVVFGAPAGWIIKKIGYRKAMMIAFFIMALGMVLFVPSAKSVSFPLFLVALFVGGIGNTLLQASVNPYVTIIGPVESAAMRMSLMGIMNKSAWWIAPLFLGLFINLQDVQLNDIVFPFYLVAGILLVLGVFTYFTKLPEVKAQGEDETDLDAEVSAYAKGKTSILQFPHLLLGVLALFLYVGIETLPMASIIDFAKASFGDVPNLEGYSKYVTIGLVVGYIFGVLAIPRFISQTKALIMFAIIGIVSSLLLIYLPAKYAFYALLLTSFANSLMWPAIWPLAMIDLGKFTKTGASLLVMGIVGGAVIPLIFGYLVDAAKGVADVATVANYQVAYWVMVPCYLFILYFALFGHKIRLK
ncbi:MAG TPA: glucose/galactose MFS transporter [Marinilabiliales bacterium]|nr:MAG: glucose/galactose MFS transporter [Bacteroidetes bacterium GWA2_40_14]OFX65070.1 MAG: glucose/galactose MFS transporter [Bacteroidetes bacterium GWC2_40_13]OFX74918.1 MAG: glucose/galactose MFS transporter [Bacteroidetes bacterium GWD2_40_43]OFX94264.1 MAG: glucose/galactose MFS transporter [Bacteroidetes bacterium GWE2_40_63]OFY23667.1 MAG: glucose/galactose MFS transporter [Bacteroidetes bacterium GWF2_40_13]OFZ25256.1 MAG: glucose/galactose MFS transporter [Bacteroidetes bacterium R